MFGYLFCRYTIITYFIKWSRKVFYFINFTVAECVDGFYNTQCSGVCGACINGDVCEKVEGHCISGCMPNYQEPLCEGIYLNL